MGNEVYWYKNKNDLSHQIMHCLVGTFIKAMPADRVEQDGDILELWPVKIILPPNKSRILYFGCETD